MSTLIGSMTEVQDGYMGNLKMKKHQKIKQELHIFIMEGRLTETLK